MRRNHKRPTSGPSSLLPLIGALNSQQRFTNVSFHFPHHVQCPKTRKNVLDHLMVETDDNDAHFGSGWASEPPTWPGHGARQCPLPRSSCVLLLLLSFHCAAREYSIKIDLYQHFFYWVTTHLYWEPRSPFVLPPPPTPPILGQTASPWC